MALAFSLFCILPHHPCKSSVSTFNFLCSVPFTQTDLLATSYGLSLQCMYITYHNCNTYTSTLKVKTVHLSKTPVYWYIGALVYLVGKDLLQCNSVHRTLHKGSPENEPTCVFWEETCNCVNYCIPTRYYNIDITLHNTLSFVSILFSHQNSMNFYVQASPVTVCVHYCF